jgi:hypothetical protein
MYLNVCARVCVWTEVIYSGYEPEGGGSFKYGNAASDSILKGRRFLDQVSDWLFFKNSAMCTWLFFG